MPAVLMWTRPGRLVVLPAVLAVTGLIFCWGASERAVAAVAPQFLGVTPAPQLPTDQDIQRMGSARVGTMRFMLNWGQVEPVQGAGYNFSEIDRVIAGAAQQGITVLPFVYGTPPWARNCAGVPASACDRVSPLTTPQGRQGWANFLAAAVARYGPKGTLWTNPSDAFSPPFRPVTRWQIWSEPNSPNFFRPRVSPKAYKQLLSLSVSTIRGADPGATFVLGGMFATPPKPGMSMRKFLDRLYGLKGVKALFDAVALHPYAPNVAGIRAQLVLGRQVMNEHHDSKTRVEVTEIGWGSATHGPGGRGLFKGVAGQASLLKQSFKFLLKNRKRFKIVGVDWFSWKDIGAGQAGFCILCESFGLLNADSSAKPSLAAFASFTGGS
jgi:polysaccharide biosynthesis protein PslG